MKITAVETTIVNIPYEAPTLACAWRKRGFTRTVLEVSTDSGIVGVGESDGGKTTAENVRRLTPNLIGRSPYDVERILWDISPPLSPNPRVQSGIEMALWDIMGKACSRPVCDLLGGAYRDEIQVSGYLFFREKGPGGAGGELTPEAIVDQAQMLVERYGVVCLKLKAGVIEPPQEARAMAMLRERFGADMGLRIDPNAIWSPEESIRLARRMGELDLEWIEDPTVGIDAMARVRRSDPTPLATNMCIRDFTELAAGTRAEAVDIVLGDPGIWGGILPCKKLAAVCETFSFGYSLHSANEMGISTAAFLHIAASTPNCSYPIDTHTWFQQGDVITEELRIVNGRMRVPGEPGLGVAIDHDKLRYHAELNKRDGDYGMEPIRHMRPRWGA